MTALPDPPLDEHGLRVCSPMLSSALVGGLVGGCCVCETSSVTWLDLASLDMPPVTDRSGRLNDYTALHERCVLALVQRWAILLHGDPGEGEDDTEPPAGVGPPSHDRVPRRSPQGAYARRGVS